MNYVEQNYPKTYALIKKHSGECSKNFMSTMVKALCEVIREKSSKWLYSGVYVEPERFKELCASNTYIRDEQLLDILQNEPIKNLKRAWGFGSKAENIVKNIQGLNQTPITEKAIVLNLTLEEDNRLTSMANESGLSVSEFVKSIIFS